jgi:hypothetical protein
MVTGNFGMRVEAWDVLGHSRLPASSDGMDTVRKTPVGGQASCLSAF